MVVRYSQNLRRTPRLVSHKRTLKSATWRFVAPYFPDLHATNFENDMGLAMEYTFMMTCEVGWAVDWMTGRAAEAAFDWPVPWTLPSRMTYRRFADSSA